MNNVLTLFNDFRKEHLSRCQYLIPVFMFSIMAYGFSIFNRTVSIDDLLYSYYISENFSIAGMRWGNYLLSFLFSTKEYSPFVGKYVSWLALVLAGIMVSFLFFCIGRCKKTVCYTIASCMFITYPLVIELWEYSYLGVSVSTSLGIISLLIIYCNINNPKEIKDHISSFLLSSIIMVFVFSLYESAIFIYITLVFVIIYFKLIKREFNKIKDWLFYGCMFTLPLFFAFIFKYLIGFVLVKVTGTTVSAFGDTKVYWASNSLYELFHSLAVGSVIKYFIRGLTYFPISEFVIFLFVFMFIISRDSIKTSFSCLIIGSMLIASLFFLSLLKGKTLPYRHAQTIELFISFVPYLALYETEGNYIQKKKAYSFEILAVLFLFFCTRQGVYTSELICLNNQRSDNEAMVIQNIGYRLYTEFDSSKKVVFCGNYHLGRFIESQIFVPSDNLEFLIRDLDDESKEKFVETNVNSCINWAMEAYNNQKTIEIYLSYYGYDVDVNEDFFDINTNIEYETIAERNGMKPLDIKDMGNYILVYFGEIGY